MTRSLQINVQIDWLPDIADNGQAGTTTVQRYVGVRVSASVTPVGGDRAKPDDVSYLLPWRWKTPGGGAWDPSLPTSWRAWPIQPAHDNVAASVGTSVELTPCRRSDANVPPKFAQRREQVVGSMIKPPSPQPFDPASLETSDGNASVPTLFGFVESMTTMPAPLPEANAVWTCLKLPPNASATDYVIVPVFGVAGTDPNVDLGKYDADPGKPPALNNGNWTYEYQPVPDDGTLLKATALVKRIESAPELGDRIILEKDFLVGGASTWAGVIDEDWMAALPHRIAKILDPAQRLAEGLEQIIAEIRQDPFGPQAMLLKSPDNRKLLRSALAVVHWRMLSHSAQSTTGVFPLAVGIARSRPAADNFSFLLLSSAREVRLATATEFDPATFQVWSDDRVTGLLGLPRDTTVSDPATVSRVDTSESVRDWLLAYWSAKVDALPLGAAATPLLHLSAVQWNVADKKIERDDSGLLGLLDMSTLAGDATASMAFDLSVDAADAGAKLHVALKFGDAAVTDAELSADIPKGPSAVTLTITRNLPGTPSTFAMTIGGAGIPPVELPNDPALQRAAHLELAITSNAALAPAVTASFAGIADGIIKRLLDNVSGQTLRDQAALVYAAPFIPFIVAGRLPDGSDAKRAQGKFETRLQKIAATLGPWAQNRINAECDAALQTIRQPGAATPIDTLFTDAAARAVKNATTAALALAAADMPCAEGYGVSVKAVPIVFPIDQPQPIEGQQDLWHMFSGMGVLAARSDNSIDWPDQPWFSLNVAELHVLDQDHSVIDFDGGSTLVQKKPFDPVAVQVSEVGGVRGGCITYDNRTLIGTMAHDPAHVQPDRPSAPRRMEAYAFPHAREGEQAGRGRVKLPALCFGKRYFFLPYVIGHGGSLPICLRDSSDPSIATKMRGDGGRIELSANELPGGAQQADDLVRRVDYLRTTPVSAPRLDDPLKTAILPGVPEGVFPLAAELPILPAPITLQAGETIIFYRNKEATQGTLEFTWADASSRALQIDIGGLPDGSVGADGRALPARPEIHLSIVGSTTEDMPIAFDDVKLTSADWPTDTSLGLRVTIGANGVALLKEQTPKPDGFVECPGIFTFARQINGRAVDLSKWRVFWIALTNPPGVHGGDAFLMPPLASLGRAQLDGTGAYQITEPMLVAPDEIAHRKRVIHVLDGIGKRRSSDPDMRFPLRRPAVEFATYERWINWTMDQVGNALNQAHDQLVLKTPTRESDLSLDDPAVERLVVECVQLFPVRRSLGRRFVDGTDWSGDRAWQNPFRQSVSDPSRHVDFSVNVATNAGLMPETGSTASSVNVAAGGVYELRFYGAVPEAKQSFADKLPKERFGKGAWEGLLRFKDHRLGAALTLTVEVSTDTMPVFGTDASSDPLHIERVLSPSFADAANVRLALSYVNGVDRDGRLLNYVPMRYVSHVALLNQRWGWRGRPLPPVPESVNSIMTTAAQEKNVETKNFENVAFVDRRDDDIGVIDETRLHLAHLLPRSIQQAIRPIPPAQRTASDDFRPSLFIKDLKYRGGANWWRFALRATSRYAAMRPALNLTRYTHRSRASSEATWHSLLIGDRETGRVPKRPGLMLVLPLTERLMPDASVPPLLAIFSEPMFANFNIGDGVEVALDYARHSLPDVPAFSADAAQLARAHEKAKALTQAEMAYARAPNDPDVQLALRRARADASLTALSRAEVVAREDEARAKVILDSATNEYERVKSNPASPEKQKIVEARDQANLAYMAAQKQREHANQASDAASIAHDQAVANQTDTSKSTFVGPADIQRFWPEIGPDPVLTGEGHSGVPVPLRLDGPLGYTFDRETEAPRFGRSGFVVTPVPQDLDLPEASEIEPWTLARLRFRRVESIETSCREIRPIAGQKMLLRSKTEDAAAFPPGVHEGLVIDFGKVEAASVFAKVQVEKGALAAPAWTTRFIQTTLDLLPESLSISLDTDLGPAGTFSTKMTPSGVAQFRLVLSQRDPPEASTDAYEPILDVSVRLLIDDGLESAATRSQAGAWLTVACLPLLAGGKTFRPNDPVYVTVDSAPPQGGSAQNALASGDAGPRVVGVRLTSFTASMWSQFTQDVSLFEVTLPGGPVRRACPVTALSVVVDAGTHLPSIRLRKELDAVAPVQSVRWLPAHAGSQLAGEVALIVTAFVRDAFDRTREAPVAIYRILDGQGTQAHGVELIWNAGGKDDPVVLDKPGRVRLLTLMRWQKRASDTGAAPLTDAPSLKEYFGAFDEIGMEADDARGRILGVSRPIDFN
ncbi:hypothetical protein [Paraburkholderia sp. SIMBA_053]|uniref:hypothetical protein n=1 Tax=Paraburkholderia sp. SIMBA_053 TaxID=3085794 RepID=UPI003978B969